MTNKPNVVAALTVPENSSPRRSRMKRHLSHASTSREASSARRSLALQCSPAETQCAISVSPDLAGPRALLRAPALAEVSTSGAIRW